MRYNEFTKDVEGRAGMTEVNIDTLTKNLHNAIREYYRALELTKLEISVYSTYGNLKINITSRIENT